ncbi:LacI family DNA-binding transcriptional regulator [Hoeflea sp.]|uniref:LacI family DNA-binding transcriptional regulator n=1 Tax=Hoeflea sp. TaxID=1940281 RepID=UPI003B01F127
MPSLAEIAKLAGVSPAVVSRVVNKDATLRISKETLERVESVVRETGYTPNRAAKSLRSTETGLIALVVHDVTNPIYAEITKGAQAAATKAGKAILLVDASGGSESTSRLLELIGGHGVDGLILQADQSVSDQVLARAANENVRTVLLQAKLDAQLKVVSLPDEIAARTGVRHLMDQGHSKIGCIATVKGLSFTEDRVTGWKNCLTENGLKWNEDWLRYAEPDIAGGQEAMASLLSSCPEITAVLCCNVLSAIGAMAVALSRKIEIPSKCAIVAIHDIPFAEYATVPLTTVSMPLFQLGKMSVETLLDKNTGQTPACIVVPDSPQLIRRNSS